MNRKKEQDQLSVELDELERLNAMQRSDEQAPKRKEEEATGALNVDMSRSVLKDIRLIAAYKDISIKELVSRELTKMARREKKKMLAELSGDD